MSTLQPKGQDLRNAVKWISDEYQAGTGVSRAKLVDQAAMKFNLSPKDVEFLTKFVKEEL